jgi:adenylate kinase family enzyme
MNFIINLFGPSAAGKSTTAALLKAHIDDLEIIDFDVIKRQIPEYDWQKHAQAGREMTLDQLRSATEREAKILLLMPSSKNQEEFSKINSIAANQNYQLINVGITAPQDILIDRYKDRLANIDPAKKKWKFKTLDEFKAKLAEPYYIPKNTTTFDSSIHSPVDIVSAILVLIQNDAS